MKIKLTPTFRSLILLGIAVFTSIDSSAQAYRLDFQVKDLASQEVYLSYFYGKGQFYRDTSKVDESGKFFFEGKDTLAHGMYSIIAQNLKLFDFLVDAQEIQFSTDTMDIVKNMKIKDSKENEIFFEYMRFLDKQTEQVRLVRKQMKGLDKNSDKYVEYQDQVKRIDKDVKSFMAELHKKYPGSLTSNFIYALDYPTVPDPPKDEKWGDR